MIALLAAGTLVLTLAQDQFQQTAPRFVQFTRDRAPAEAKLEVLTVDGYPAPMRSRCWWVAGGYGLGASFASIAGIIAENINLNASNNGSVHNARTSALGMLIGFAVGVVPGVLLGEQARYEENGLARGVTSLLAVGSTVALAATANHVF